MKYSTIMTISTVILKLPYGLVILSYSPNRIQSLTLVAWPMFRIFRWDFCGFLWLLQRGHVVLKCLFWKMSPSVSLIIFLSILYPNFFNFFLRYLLFQLIKFKSQCFVANIIAFCWSNNLPALGISLTALIDKFVNHVLIQKSRINGKKNNLNEWMKV